MLQTGGTFISMCDGATGPRPPGAWMSQPKYPQCMRQMQEASWKGFDIPSNVVLLKKKLCQRDLI